MRSTTDRDLDCDGSSSYAEQLSIVSAFLDLSTLYGVDVAVLNGLRTGQGGRLRADRRWGHEWLPAETDSYDTCNVYQSDEVCYQGADVRVNQNVGLAMMAIIHLREHNRLAGALMQINPHWSDERLFEEARRINIATYQHITFYEWLPHLLGELGNIRFDDHI